MVSIITIAREEFSWMILRLKMIMRVLAIVRTRFCEQLMLKDIRTMHFSVYKASLGVEDGSTFVKVSMVVPAVISKRLGLLQVSGILTPLYLEIKHDALVICFFSELKELMKILHV